jgi:hypothetical protein
MEKITGLAFLLWCYGAIHQSALQHGWMRFHMLDTSCWLLHPTRSHAMMILTAFLPPDCFRLRWQLHNAMDKEPHLCRPSPQLYRSPS